MASTTAAVPTLEGIPTELRNNIFGLVADATPRKPIILGRKVAQAANQFMFNGDVRAQALYAVVQHPLEMTSRQTRADFQRGFHKDYARSQTYEFVVDNFDFEQLRLYEELQRAKYGDWFRLVFSRSQIRRNIDLKWLENVSFELRFQMNHDVVASATTLAKSIMSCNHSFLGINNYAMHFVYRDLLTGVVDQTKTMTTAQAKEVYEILKKLRKDRDACEPIIFNLLTSFTARLDAHSYRESPHKDDLASLAARWKM